MGVNFQERMAGIRERCEKATEGPWLTDDDGKDVAVQSHAEYPPRNVANLYRRVERPYSSVKGDADFTAHARTDLPWLADRLEEAVALLSDLIAEYRPWQEFECDCGAVLDKCPNNCNTHLLWKRDGELRARLERE